MIESATRQQMQKKGLRSQPYSSDVMETSRVHAPGVAFGSPHVVNKAPTLRHYLFASCVDVMAFDSSGCSVVLCSCFSEQFSPAVAAGAQQ
eukprot:1864077-Amphidinium_carterae.1